jgi:hypothetical protein
MTTRRRRRRVAALAVLLIATVALAAISVASRSHGPHAGRRSGAPVPSERGAVKTAVAALYDLSIPAILDRARFRDSVARLAAPGFEDKVNAAFGTTGAGLAMSFQRGPRVLRAAPLGYRVVRYAPPDASVAIWSVAIAASRGFDPDAQWRTVVIELSWSGHAWKVTGGSGSAGPDLQTPLADLAREASGFRSLTHAP